MNTINRIRSMPTECLLNNIIDEDLQAVLRPLAVFQAVFMISRFSIINNFITPNSKIYYARSIIGAAILIFINWYRFTEYKASFSYHGTLTLSILLWFDCFYYSVTTVVLYVVSALQSNNTVLLIVKLQLVMRTTNINKTEMLNNMKFWNWIYIICIFAVYLIYSFSLSVFIYEFNFTHLMFVLPTLIFDVNVVYASRTVTFISNLLALWNDKMMYYEKTRFQENPDDKLQGKAMLNAYLDIMKSFLLTEKVYQFAIIYQALDTFVHFLITVQSYLEYRKLDPMAVAILVSPKTITITSVWLSKNIILLISLSNACNKFYAHVEVAKALCTKILPLEKSDLRKTCKNVLRFNGAAFRKLSAFGVFEVDAMLPLRLLSAVLTYIVVLLQFAFL